MLADCLISSLLVVLAVIRTPSTPKPSDKRSASETGSKSSVRRNASAPLFFANSTRSLLKSNATTLQPLARRIWTVNCPTKPNPITEKVSPILGFESLIP